MNLRIKGKGSFQYRRDVRYVVSNFICEKGGYIKFVNVFKNRNFLKTEAWIALSLL